MVNESRKIMGSPNLRLTATCVRVPVLRTHAEALNLELEQPFPVEKPGKSWPRPLGWCSLKIGSRTAFPCPLM
jgi:aspartate-semialdehyde dehydrogenase